MPKKHKTTHAERADEGGQVCVYCECGWRDVVDVAGLTFMEAVRAIFAARDAHEADPKGEAAILRQG